MEFTEKQISAVARVLSDRSAYDCGVHKDDNWHVYGEDYLESAKAALAVLSAAAPQVVVDERAYTAEEARKIFLDQVRHLVSYWERESREPTAKGKLEGLAFSIMNIFDGTSGLPAFDIVCAPHPEDKQYHIDEGSKYFVPGMAINECHLHEMLFSGRAAAPVQEQESVAFKEVGSFLYVGVEYVATSGDDPRGIKLYRPTVAPVQPVAVPDGYEVSDNSETWNAIAAKVREEMATGMAILAAPAAQGEAKELTVEDLYQMYRDSYGKLNCEVAPFDTLDEMEQKAWRNLAAAIAAKAES